MPMICKSSPLWYTPWRHYVTSDMIPQLFVAPKENNWLAAPLHVANDNVEVPICTHWPLAADVMVQPVVNTPFVGLPHVVQRTFHDWVLRDLDLSQKAGTTRWESRVAHRSAELGLAIWRLPLVCAATLRSGNPTGLKAGPKNFINHCKNVSK